MAVSFLPLGVGLAAGFGIGGLYFGGLWLTVCRIQRARRPRLLLLASVAVRLAAAVAAFYALVPLGWTALAAAMGGFLIARRIWLSAKGGPGMAQTSER
jgi:F1F0 ATPase subunit 2